MTQNSPSLSLQAARNTYVCGIGGFIALSKMSCTIRLTTETKTCYYRRSKKRGHGEQTLTCIYSST